MVDACNQPSIAHLLLASAQQDLAAGRWLAAGPGLGDALVGFHVQQAVEKALKAVLSAYRVEFRRTHDLLILLDLLEDNQLPAPPAADWLDELNPYAVEARYGTINPEGLDRNRALTVAADVMAWAHNLVAGVHTQ
ncbi:MAG: HEPN domain-containing protein [Hydrogenophaga sp.]|uniref:HEPN domain-containing protein n=1 Tax=Hydrogenophaga sp. TaxID=1904254 RepID=UPI0027685806|nr:HEPN domain-containing protein [Hydrogenophaga sp.]MDP2419189.1 HEPN domain-containing protein [Hydrogenophaga sp.]MDZ4187010.1 HEPN domain-containing protein [Hydrogenophaga sp.]